MPNNEESITYYVATVARYVLVEAANEDDARCLAEPQLYELYAETRRQLRCDADSDSHSAACDGGRDQVGEVAPGKREDY